MVNFNDRPYARTAYNDPDPVYPLVKEYDDTQVSPEVKNYVKQLTSKMSGVDTREVLRRAVEIIDLVAGDAKDTSVDTKARQDDVENRFDDQMAGNTDIDEVIDARRPEGGEAYPTLRRRLDEEHQEVTTQMGQNATYYLLSKLNLTDNGESNLQKIMEKLTKDNIVFIVDGIFPLSAKETHVLSYDLNMISFNGGGFTFSEEDDVDRYFDTRASVRLKNVKFFNQSNQLKLLFGNLNTQDTIDIEDFIVEGCDFEGNIRLSYIYQVTTLKQVEVKKCTIQNTENSFFQISNAEINVVNINNNKIKNWFYRCFSITEGEDGHIQEINVENNNATNDDHWIFTEDTVPGTYYVFALINGQKTNYHNNNVENMKSTRNIALYDCYAGGPNNNYTGNTFKNNVCFDLTRVNQLMKAKSENSKKTFNNNKFIIERDFINRFGYSSEGLYVRLYDLWGGDGEKEHTEPVAFEIMNNHIEVPNLQFEVSPRLVEQFEFKNNTIITKKIKDNLIYTRADGSLFVVRNNNIFVEEVNTFNLFSSNTSAKHKHIVVENNVIERLTNIISVGDFESAVIRENNILKEMAQLTTYLITEKYISQHNVYSGKTVKRLDNNLNAKYIISENTGLVADTHIYLHDLESGSNVRIVVKSGKEISEFNVSVNGGMVEYTTPQDVEWQREIKTTAGNGNIIKNVGDGNATLTLNNTTSFTRLTLTTNTNKLTIIQLEVV